MPQPRLSPRLARRCTLVRAAPGWDCINARQRKYARESRLAVSPSCLTSPPMRRGPRKRGTFRARHRCALERRTRRWRGESAANPSLNRRSDEFLESIKNGSRSQSACRLFLVIKIILHNFDVFTREKRRIPKKWLVRVTMLLFQHVNVTF